MQLLADAIVEPGVPTRLLGKRRNGSRVAADPRRLEVGEVGEGHEHCIEPFGPDSRDGRRLGGEHAIPLVLGVDSRNDVGNLCERVDDRRVIGLAAPPE